MIRFSKAAILAAPLVGAAIMFAPSASASTPGCVSNPFCGNQVSFGNGLVFDVYHQVAASNNKVISFGNSGTDKATDFVAYAPTSGPMVGKMGSGGPVKAFRYAPGGVESTLCMSDPGPGYGTIDKIVLRPCNNSRFQVFVPMGPSGHDGYVSWRNAASNQFIQDNGIRSQLTTVKDGSVGDPDNNVPTFAANQDWKFIQAPALS